MSEPKLVKTRWGFYRHSPIPSDSELQAYYAEKYYQQGKGSYNVTYSHEEIRWIKLRAELICLQICKFIPTRSGSGLLDVGCGEGWLMQIMSNRGWPVRGVDFSSTGIQQQNPKMAEHLDQGNVFEKLQTYTHADEKFDAIVLCNVLEHVADPEWLLELLKELVTSDGIVVLMVPDDFSALHDYLIENKLISREFWLAYPDHLSYFNSQSMRNFLVDKGYELRHVFGDFPIDLCLLNDKLNYIDNPEIGPSVHKYRIRQDLFMADVSGLEKLLEYYSLIGEMEIGRNLIYFAGVRQ